MSSSLSPLANMVYHIVSNLVDTPNQINIEEKSDGVNLSINLKVAQEDLGKVIGKQGKIAQSIRTLLHSSSIKQKRKTLLEISANEAPSA